MAQTILLKRSTTASKVPTTAQLTQGELALNTTDGKAYMLNTSGTAILEVGHTNVTGDVTGSGSNELALTLTNTGVSAGTYKSVTVDTKGRVTGGTVSLIASDIPAIDWSKITTGKPTTLNGYNITDAVSNSIIGAASGIVPLGADSRIAATYLPSYVDDVVEGANISAFPVAGDTGKIYIALDTNKPYRWSGSVYVEISASPGSTDAVSEGITNLYFTAARAIAAVTTVSGNAGTATKLTNARTIGATGDGTWSVSFDGSTNVSAAMTLAASGVGAGTYKSVTVNSKGLVTAGTNPTTLAGYGIADALSTTSIIDGGTY